MTETIHYDITGTAGEAELRRYPPLVLATVEDDGDDRGFRLLFAYIIGRNRARNTIPMTAPVISGAGTMLFVMPAGRTEDQMPEPTDDRVRIETVPAREVAVIRFAGHAHRHDVEAAASRLLGELGKAGIAARGTQFLMRYNAPMTPGFLRRNEVGVVVER